MKIKEVIAEGKLENKYLNRWTKKLKIIFYNFDNLSNKFGRDEAIKQLQASIILLSEEQKFLIFGDNNAATKKKYIEYIELCNAAKEKINSGL